MSSKKLLICSPSAAVRGGVETIIDDLCHELPALGWEPFLALGKGARFNDVTAYRAAHLDLPILEMDGTSGTRQGRRESIRSVISRVRPDVVLSARIFDAYEVLANLKQRSDSPRLAVAIRGYEPGYLYDARRYKNIIDLCVVDGNLLTAASIDWAGLDPERVISIPGGVHPASVPHRSSGAVAPLRIGYVGRLSQTDKRVLDLVQLVSQLDKHGLNFQLSIVGEGPDEATLREQMDRFVSSGRVTFRGWKTREQLYRDVYPYLDCMVNFSPAEGVTIAGREAMAHSVVPVMSRFVGLRSEGVYVHEHNSLTFPVGDIAEASNCILRLSSEPGLLDCLKQNASSSQTDKYSFSGAMDAWAKMLNRCLENVPQKGAIPTLPQPQDGRLARLGLSPRLAQRVRTILRRKMLHSNSGNEWPHISGLMSDEAAREIMEFAEFYERNMTCAM